MKLNRTNLHKYQNYAAEFIKSHPVAAVLLECGLGKTIISLTAISDLMFDSFETQKVLVVCPLRVCQVWADEIQHWEQLSEIRYIIVTGTPAERLSALKADADIYIINRENLVWLINQDKKYLNFDMAVLDELSSFKANSQRTKAFLKLRPRLKRVVGLTGTPSSNGLMDLYYEFRCLDMGERLFRFIGQYRNAFFRPDRCNGNIVYSYKALPGAEKEIYDRIGDITISMKAVDHLQMPELISTVYPVTLDEQERQRYEDMKKDLILALPEQEITAANAAALSNKLSQMANGAVYADDDSVVHIHERKLDALEDIIESANGKPVLVAYWYKFFANGATPGGILEYPGAVKDPERVRESWNKGFGGSSNANKVAILEEGMKYTPISISPEQAQFLETRKFQINEIARIFRVPPHMVGDLEKSSFSNIEQQSLEFVKYTLDPWVSRWEQAMMRSLLSQEEKTQYFVKFNVDGLLRGDYQSRMNGYSIGRQNGWMSANDIRELENLDRIPTEQGGDLYLINGNMTKLADAGIFAASGKEEESNEEVLEVEEPDGSESGDTGTGAGEDAVSKRHNRRGQLV